jgi:hypothetical protein
MCAWFQSTVKRLKMPAPLIPARPGIAKIPRASRGMPATAALRRNVPKSRPVMRNALMSMAPPTAVVDGIS